VRGEAAAHQLLQLVSQFGRTIGPRPQNDKRHDHFRPFRVGLSDHCCFGYQGMLNKRPLDIGPTSKLMLTILAGVAT